MELVSQAEFARMRGVSREAIRKQVAKGKIPVHGDRKMIDPVEAKLALAGSVERVNAVEEALADDDASTEIVDAPAVPRGPTLTDLKARTEDERAQLLRLERLAKIGELLPRSRVEAEQEEAARLVGRAFDALINRAEDIFAAGQVNGVQGIRATLKALIREAREGLAKDLTAAAERMETDLVAEEDDDVAA